MTKFQKVFAATWFGVTVLSILTFISLAILMCFGAIGCDTRGDSIVGVATPHVETPAHLPDGSVNWRKFQVLYTSCGTFTLDYPADFVGPIPQGHGRVGQSDPSYYCSNLTYTKGDPTADD